MNKIAQFIILSTIFGLGLNAQEEKPQAGKGTYENIKVKIIDVVEIKEGDFIFRGYTIEYKGHKIMVSAMVDDGGYKVGEEIGVMVNKSEVNYGSKIHRSFSFMVMPNTSKIMKEIEMNFDQIKENKQ